MRFTRGTPKKMVPAWRLHQKKENFRKALETGREMREVVPSTDGARVKFLSGKKRKARDY